MIAALDDEIETRHVYPRALADCDSEFVLGEFGIRRGGVLDAAVVPSCTVAADSD